ncbi:MAG: cellulase family glycosylhydrolase [Actinomycetota bacterium]
MQLPTRKRPLCLMVAALITVAVLAPIGAPSAATSGIEQAGRYFVDDQGRVRILHGTAFMNIQRSSEVHSAEFNADDAAFLASNGLTLLHLDIFLSGVMPEPYTFDEAYLDGVEKIVNTAHAAGISVFLDFCQAAWANKYDGIGVPDWMAEDDGVPSTAASENLAAKYFGNPALWRALDNFWTNAEVAGAPLQDHYESAWRHVAGRFKNHPGVLGFEIMNEPFPGTQWSSCASPAGCPAFDKAMLQPFTERMGNAIKEVAPDKFVIYEPNVTFDFGANTWLEDPGTRPAALSYHIYCLGLQFGTPPTGDPGCEQLGERPQFGYAADYAQKYGIPLILSEFGHFTTTKEEDVSPIIDRVANMADEIGSSWTYWLYALGNPEGDDPDYTSSSIVKDLRKPPTEDNLVQNRVNAIVRAYPRAVAGTPLSYAWEGEAKKFTLEYTPARADGTGTFEKGSITEVFVPERQFPTGYTVDVDGATVDSEPGAPILRLKLDEGATRVFVTITPAG